MQRERRENNFPVTICGEAIGHFAPSSGDALGGPLAPAAHWMPAYTREVCGIHMAERELWPASGPQLCTDALPGDLLVPAGQGQEPREGRRSQRGQPQPWRATHGGPGRCRPVL